MSLLVLDRVSKRYASGRRQQMVLRQVSLDVAPGELVGIWGRRRSGRTTLLRVAAGIERPDEGVVRFDGIDLARDRGRILGSQLAYCHMRFGTGRGQDVAEHVAVALLASGISPSRARARAEAVLERAGAASCSALEPRELDATEAVRASIARGLVVEPRMLLIDEPTNGVDLRQRDSILELLRGIADEGVAVVVTAGEMTALTGSDRVLSISDGELRGDAVPTPASVVPLRPAHGESAG
jgi:putative ABC transport system ATP-binding protein